jgi:hypothetical protein
MAKLYVANCTKQRHEFLYRAPEQKNHIKEPIEIGSQIMVWKDAPREELQGIIEQHEMYGLVPVAEIDRTKHFVGMCYQWDRPVDVNKIMYTVENNDTVLEEAALEKRKEAAQVISQSLGQIAQDAGNSLNTVELEIQELARPGHDVKVYESITVKREGGRSRRG